MYLIVTASSDAYIQNKIIGNKFRTSDANTGRAGTLDLFKLYGESVLPEDETVPGTYALDVDSNGTPETAIELSRILIKFDYDKLQEQTNKTLDINSDNFKAYLSLKSVSAGQFTPKDFTVDVVPLAQKFDEGIGKDVISFQDLDACNFVTASHDGAVVNAWNAVGAGQLGVLGAENLDAFNRADFGAGEVSVVASQNFKEGGEDLNIDVTHLVSASLAGQLDNHGFRVSFNPTQEADSKTRFVKRFSSRHASDPYVRPSLNVVWDDTILDNSENSLFDYENTLYFQNYVRGSEANLKIGATTYSGDDCFRLVLSNGLFAVTASASSVSDNTTSTVRPGLYKASFTVNSNDNSSIRTGDKVSDFAIKSGSLDLTTEWQLNDGSLTFFTGSITLKNSSRGHADFTSRDPDLTVLNLRNEYKKSDTARIRVFGRDITSEFKEKYGTIPQRRKSVIYDEVYFGVVDNLSGDVAIPINQAQNGTRLSTDSQGMFFDLDMDNLVAGRNYHFMFSISERGTETIVTQKEVSFRVV